MILVTGSAGFIGSNFVLEWLQQSGARAVTLDALTYAGNPANLAQLKGDDRHALVPGDIADRALVGRLLREHRVRAVVNFAAESHVDRSILGPGAFVQTNIVGTFALLEEARAYWGDLKGREHDDFRFLHVSTDEVYGSLGPADVAFTESTPYAPNSPYSASKASADHLVRAYHHTYGLPTLTTNCSNNYGPYQFPEKLIPLMILNALSGKSLPVYGDGQQIRDWLYVGDHCAALRRVLDAGRPGQTYNIGGSAERANLQVIHTLCGLLDEIRPAAGGRPHSDLISFVKDRPGHDRRYAVDFRKLEGELGWCPSETFESGIRKTLNWYLDNQAWVDGITSGEYRNWIQTQYESKE